MTTYAAKDKRATCAFGLTMELATFPSTNKVVVTAPRAQWTAHHSMLERSEYIRRFSDSVVALKYVRTMKFHQSRLCVTTASDPRIQYFRKKSVDHAGQIYLPPKSPNKSRAASSSVCCSALPSLAITGTFRPAVMLTLSDETSAKSGME
jgi:hypothetical protein